MATRNITAQEMYRAAQSPIGWLISAERLRDAAEVILAHEVQYEIPYFRAHEAAANEAVGIAYSEGNKSGSAQVQANPPNYPPAQLY